MAAPASAWLAGATHGLEYDTWHALRFFVQWADAEMVAALAQVYAYYDAADIARTLRATMAVYSRIVRAAEDRLECAYPAAEEEWVTVWVEACLTAGE